MHDAVARLPNGEGTRMDVLKLLKMSQYVSAEASESQLMAVTSGAMDRLKYRTEPCIEYRPMERLWVYLLRSHSQEQIGKVKTNTKVLVVLYKQSLGQ